MPSLCFGCRMIGRFDSDCHKCSRLAAYCRGTKVQNPEYHGAPVDSFGDSDYELLIVGLAPGMHGANATGRPFTGDHAGVILYRNIHEFGFSNTPDSIALDDGLILQNCRITNAVRCLPPQNKPIASEVNNCNAYLQFDITGLSGRKVILALGRIAHEAILKALGVKKSCFPFAHAALHNLPGGMTLLDSYHCSRYNLQTRRLTDEMFADVFRVIRQIIP